MTATIATILLPLVVGCAIGIVIGGLLFARRPRESAEEATPEVARRYRVTSAPPTTD